MPSYPNFLTYQATAGRREDVLDIITQISPESTPFLSRLGVVSVHSAKHEWLQDSLNSGTATGGAAIEGESATARTISDRGRLQNFTQISEYVFGVSGTQEAVSHFGLESEYSYQLEKAMKTLKIMQEQILLNSTSGTGDSASARTMTGLIDCIQTAVCTGSGGVCALTETMFNGILQTIFENGGEPDIAFVNGFNKRRISSFATSNTRYQEPGVEGRLRNYVGIYESDFGVIEVVLDRYMPKSVVPVLDMDKYKIGYLRKPFVNPLANDGDRKRAQLLTEYTFLYMNEKSSGKLSALATS